MQYKSQAVAMPYFIAAIGLFVGQIIFGLILGLLGKQIGQGEFCSGVHAGLPAERIGKYSIRARPLGTRYCVCRKPFIQHTGAGLVQRSVFKDELSPTQNGWQAFAFFRPADLSPSGRRGW